MSEPIPAQYAETVCVCGQPATWVMGKAFGEFDLGPAGTLLCENHACDANQCGFQVTRIDGQEAGDGRS